ncbi:MAG: glycosyltransferase family 39 protein, partial [Flavobacteriales bacterium]|nr:glycosyltransferase family 39 protein [Flavobacteriales bacterium]
MLILIATGLVYLNSLQNGFVPGMDDDMYILDNIIIQSFDFKAHFATYIAGNYHPLTTLSYALEYAFFGESAKAFHTTNLLLHLLNTFLVFLLISKLLKNDTIGLISAAFFALHPMHVESISWISERKDQLYTIFYLFALVQYINYNTHSKIKNLMLCGISFGFALLSKSMAVTLPLLFFAIDYYQNKRFTTKSILTKVPFFGLSVLFGIIALKSQSSGNTFYELSLNYSLFDREAMLCYSVVFYITKFFVPINLSIYHFYPNEVGLLPMLSPILLLIGCWFLWKKKKSHVGKIALFGAVFFILSLLPVLQLIPVGRAFAAERYTYIAYIGLGLPLFYQAHAWLSFPKYKSVVAVLIAVCLAGCGYLTFERNKVWKSSEVLFTDLIEKYPESGFGYYSRGVVYDHGNRLDLALSDYDNSILRNPNFYKSFNNRATIRGKKGNLKGALHDCNKSIALKPNFASAYNNRGNAKSGLGDLEGAIKDCTTAIKINPNFSGAYNNRASAHLSLSHFIESLKDFQKLNKLTPNAPEVLQGIAASYQGLKRYDKSVEYFIKSLSVQ